MITNFKLFENTNREPEVGDYIVIDYKNEHMEHVEHENLFNTHVGKILEYKKRREYFNPIYLLLLNMIMKMKTYFILDLMKMKLNSFLKVKKNVNNI